MHRILLIILTILLLNTINVFSQEITVDGGFIEEEMKLGAPIKYFLKASYPKDIEILFPDKNHSFIPFEFNSKVSFPSIYDSSLVIDSAVYTISSFEIDKFQTLSLPIYLIKNADSTAINAPLDSIKFIELVTQVTDTTALKTNLDFLGVPLALNTTYIYIGIGVGVSILIMLIFIFGIKLVVYLKVKKVAKAFNHFEDEFNLLANKAYQNENRKELEKTIIFWKKYLEKLEKRPYTKLTTKQLIAIKGDETLGIALKALDRIIYGKSWSSDTKIQLDTIKNLAREYQERKIAAIKNG